MSKEGVKKTQEFRRPIKHARLTERDGVTGKECSRCGYWTPLEGFHVSNTKGKGGRVSVCKICLKVKKNIQIKWTKVTIYNKLNDLYKQGENLSQSNMKNKHSGLIQACEREFGSYKNAIYAAGIDYTEFVGNPMYRRDLEEMIKELNDYIVRTGSSKGFSVNCRKTYAALAYHYGSFGKALEQSIAKTCDTGWGSWSKEKVVEELTRRSVNGVVSMRKISKELYHASVRYFGTFRLAVKASNNTVDRPFENWDKEKILSEIKNLPQASYCVAVNQNQRLVAAARQYFGSWENAVSAAGYSYENVREDVYTTNYCGHVFESIADNILSELCVSYTKYQHERWNPDYVFNYGRWGDAKLSEWTVKKSTVENYEPHCRMLTIVYMRGNTERDEMITSKTRILSVHKLIKQLPRHRQRYYLLKIESLENRLNRIESGELNEIGNRSTDETNAQDGGNRQAM
jgi:transcription elongation factor Elf1